MFERLRTSIFLIIGLLSIVQYGYSQNAVVTGPPPEQLAVSNSLLSSVSQAGMTTTILYDRVYPLADLGAFTGSANTEVSGPSHFYQSYYELYYANSSSNSMQSSADVRNNVARNYGSGAYPIGILYYKFDRIDERSIQDGLLRYQDDKLYDVPNRSRSPYKVQKTVVASPLLHQNAPWYKPGTFRFKVDPAYFFTNLNVSLNYCEIDFADGNGFRRLNPYDTAEIYYGSPGNHTLNIRVYTSDGQQSQAYADVKVAEPSFGLALNPSPSGMAICNEPPLSFQVTGEAFNSSDYNRAEGAYGAQGSVNIYFAKGNCQSKVLRKPVIFLDGFDPTNARDPDAIYRDYINDEDVDNDGKNLKLGDKFRNEGYDIIVIDYKDGGDYIERNGLMVIEALKEIWRRYSSTIEKDFVVIGPSMGALVAQYALATAENRGIDHHTRLFISFDGAHRGANIPIGLQQMIGYGLKSKIAEGSAANACRPATSGIAEDNFPLNVRSAKQMLLHHYLTGSQEPAAHPYRFTFMQHLRAAGYPKKCRKVAVINGSRNTAIQRAGLSGETPVLNRDMNASEDILRLVIQSQAANFFLTSDKTLLGWGATASPKNNQGNTFHAFTSALLKAALGIDNRFHDDYARPYSFAPSQSVDILPGGYSNTMLQILKGLNHIEQYDVTACISIPTFNVLDLSFGLKGALLPIISLRQGRNFYAQTDVPNHSFIPTVSSIDYPDENVISYNFVNENLACTNKTPFDYVYAPDENQSHVAITTQNAVWFENEIKEQNLPTSCKPGCNFNITADVDNVNPSCNSAVNLRANCSGVDCSGIFYSWGGTNGYTANGQNVTTNAPATNGVFTYSVFAGKANCTIISASKTITVNSCPSTPSTISSGCYAIKSQKTNFNLQAMADGTIKQQPTNGQTDQLWKVTDVGNSQYQFINQNGSNQVIMVNDGSYNFAPLVLGSYTNDDRQKWSVQQNGTSGYYRIYRSNGFTWDLNNFGNNPELQLYGNTTEQFYDYRSFRFDAVACPTTPPTTTPGGLTFNTISYDCNNGQWTWQYTGGNGQSIDTYAPGAFGNRTIMANSPQTVTLDVNLRTGVNFDITAVQSGQQLPFHFMTSCGGGTTPPTTPTTPPTTTPGGLTFNTISYDCNNGQWTWQYTGGNGQSIDTYAPGAFGNRTIMANSPQTVTLDVNLRTGVNFDITAVQSGQQLPFHFMTSCGGGRLANSKESQSVEEVNFQITPNPTNGQITARFQLRQGERANLMVLSLTGEVYHQQLVVGTGQIQEEVFNFSQQAAGMYIIRLVGQNQSKMSKIILSR